MIWNVSPAVIPSILVLDITKLNLIFKIENFMVEFKWIHDILFKSWQKKTQNLLLRFKKWRVTTRDFKQDGKVVILLSIPKPLSLSPLIMYVVYVLHHQIVVQIVFYHLYIKPLCISAWGQWIYLMHWGLAFKLLFLAWGQFYK